MPAHWDERQWPLHDGTTVVARFTTRVLGTLHVDAPAAELADRRRTVVDAEWNWVRQIHGAAVVEALGPGSVEGTPADALVTRVLDTPISVTVADCVPVLLWGRGRIGAVHAGWRGTLDGVIQATVSALDGPDQLRAAIGPCIEPASYEFGSDLLDSMAERYGDEVRSVSADGRPALDMAAAVTAALHEAGLSDPERVGGATAAEPERYFSHRARGEAGRQALVAWREGR